MKVHYRIQCVRSTYLIESDANKYGKVVMSLRSKKSCNLAIESTARYLQVRHKYSTYALVEQVKIVQYENLTVHQYTYAMVVYLRTVNTYKNTVQVRVNLGIKIKHLFLSLDASDHPWRLSYSRTTA